ncbi:Pre-mRNA-splicing factor cwc22 [Aspergillus cristatus]|uniref:Pre-mRNA-splicing factor CWC22 n=1 Tax=Aspergillus cristatus TaxID=573508 RepID=A0A1E3BT29_ASPCR|nr:Pre-mRNA-splicing factor cwc22 [Aspergillus cristatus]
MTDPVVLQSAVRVPTPPPGESQPPASRKRSPPSRSPSPNRRRSAPGDALKQDGDVPRLDDERAQERERQLAERVREHEKKESARKPMTDEEKQASAKAEYEKLLNMRSGGTYIPPARLRALQSQITDKSSKEYQRMAWEALKKSINGLINKVNVSNIKFIVPELFGENLVRGRGLFCRSIMKAQAASLPFTPIYAAMAAIVNTKLPQVGELLLSRLIVQFRKAFKRNDKAVCISSTTFIAHLCNQQVVHEMLAAQILLLLLHKPTDDSVEIAVGLTREVGQHLEEMSGPIALAVFDQFRNILHEADIDKRVQYMIEVLFQVRKDRYKDNPAVREDLDLVEEEDQITHRIGLDDEIETQDGLNIFKYDEQWEEHQEAYARLKAEILGEGSEDEDDDDESDVSSDEEEDEEKKMDIKDQSNTDLVNLRRTIYLTIMSSIDFEECCHKLMKVSLPPGLEPELPSMIIECCSQERTYSKFYGLIGERFAKINRLWSDLFEAAFAKYYDTIHRYETNRLRNIACFFGHMLSTDAIGWHVMSIIHMNEEETTSSSRIFIKILFQNLGEHLGLPKLRAQMTDEILRPSFEGLFPLDNPRNTRFSINYFTSIGFGILTEDMRTQIRMRSRSAVVHLARPAQGPATLAPDPDPGPTRTPGRHRGAVDGPTHGLCPGRLGDEAIAILLPAPAPALVPLQQDPAAAPFPTVDPQAGPYRGHRPDEAELAPTTHGIREAQVPTAHGNARRLNQSPHLESGATLARCRGLSHRLDAELRHLKADATQIVHHGHRHVAVVEVLGMIPARLALHRAGEDIQTRCHGLARHRLVTVAGRLRGVHLGGRGEVARVTIFSPGIKKQDLHG